MTRPRKLLLPVTATLLLTSLRCQAQSAEQLAELAPYEQQIATLQSRASTAETEQALTEAYLGLGNALQAQNRHEQALEAYDQALTYLRGNKGLHALEQLPVLDARIASNQALQAWEAVDADKVLAYQIAQKSPNNAALQFQALRDLGLWKLRVAEEDLLKNAMKDAREAALLYRTALERPDTRDAFRGNSIALANLYLDLASIEFVLAKRTLELPLSAYASSGGQRTTSETFCETIVGPDGRSRQVCRTLQVPNMDYFMSISDRKFRLIWDHLNIMQDAVLEAWALLKPEVDTKNRDAALFLLGEAHHLSDTFNDFVAKNARRRTGTHIAPPTGTRISR